MWDTTSNSRVFFIILPVVGYLSVVCIDNKADPVWHDRWCLRIPMAAGPDLEIDCGAWGDPPGTVVAKASRHLAIHLGGVFVTLAAFTDPAATP